MATTAIRSDEETVIDAQVRDRREAFALNITRYVAWITGILAVALLVLWLFSRQYIQLLAYAGLSVLATAGAKVYLVFHRQGQSVLGIHVSLISFLIVVFVEAVLMPWMMPSMVMAYVLLLIMGNLLLGDRGSRWLIGACVLSFLLDLIIVNAWDPSWFVPLDRRIELGIGILGSAFALVGTALIVRVVTIGQEAHFCQSQRANLEIEKRAAREQEQRGRLQSTVRQYVDYMAKVGQGGLAERLALDGEGYGPDDPLVMLGRQLNKTTAELQAMTTRIRDTANNLSAAAAEILAATTQQASGANEQSAAISQTNTTVDEVKTIAEQSVLRAQEVAEAAQRTVNVSRKGQQALQDTVKAMAQIKTRVEGISENILALSQQTQQISAIISTVNEIASQSNVLALNASVEAARAGEHGKGFAVVAVEVRNLAQQSKQATEQVRAILSDIQKATTSTVMVTEDGVKGVDAGVQSAAQTREVITQLAGVIDESAQAAMQVAAGGRQQASGMEQVALSMQNISQAMIQSLSSTRQAEKAAQDLHDLARSLTEMVEQYQL